MTPMPVNYYSKKKTTAAYVLGYKNSVVVLVMQLFETTPTISANWTCRKRSVTTRAEDDKTETIGEIEKKRIC